MVEVRAAVEGWEGSAFKHSTAEKISLGKENMHRATLRACESGIGYVRVGGVLLLLPFQINFRVVVAHVVLFLSQGQEMYH
jgi:hypothetical protein